MTTEVLDDEMEAMLRDIEAMGMTPGGDTAAVAIDDDIEAAVAAIESDAAEIAHAVASEEVHAAAAEVPEAVKPPFEGGTKIEPDPADAKAKLKEIAALEAKVAADAASKKEIEAAELKAIVASEKSAGPTPTDPENVIKEKPKSVPTAARGTHADDLIDSDQVKKDIAINPTDLDTALIEHPSLQLHYSLKTADARRSYERLKSGVEILEAKMDASYREKLGDGVKKPTEAAIRNALVADPAYASAQTKLIDAQHVWKMCEAIENSFHSRKDILLEVARDRRKEKEGAMRVMDIERTALTDAELRKKVIESMTKK